MSGLGLYIHIPFCIRKCAYCDFCSVGIGDGDESLTGRMVDCLIMELVRTTPEAPNSDVSRGTKVCNDTISTIFIGGGTPSVVPAMHFERLLRVIKERIGSVKEFTIECNPGTVDEEKLRLYRDYGVNRLSFGCQSANDDELKSLGRIHTWDDFCESYKLAREIGFENINVDLMTAIPGQTEESLSRTLDEVLRFEPEHVSVYSLIIEEGTPFFEKYADCPPVNEETDRNLYTLACERLKDAGYDHYEISNYARSGYACEHNLNYWRRGSYIGIGPAAASFDRRLHGYGIRRKNTSDLQSYMWSLETGNLPDHEEESLVKRQAQIEELMLGLRVAEGIDLQRWFQSDPQLENQWAPVLEPCIQEGLAVRKGDRFCLTDKGFFVSDRIIDELLGGIS